jgi:AcrR family transcriptional regulator
MTRLRRAETVPKIVDHDERRRDIAHAVLRVIARDGVRGADLRTVARDAGWSTGVISHYFGDKQGLLVGALREAAGTVADRMRAISRMGDCAGRVRALLEAGMPLDEERAATCRIFYHFSSDGVSDPAFRAELANYYAWWRDAVAIAVEEAQRSGLFPGHDPVELAESLVALAEGLGIQSLFDPATMPPDRLRDRLLGMVARLQSSTGRLVDHV